MLDLSTFKLNILKVADIIYTYELPDHLVFIGRRHISMFHDSNQNST